MLGIILVMVINASNLISNFTQVTGFAVGYNCNAYGVGAYDSCENNTTTTTNTPTQTSQTSQQSQSPLASTGVNSILPLGLGLLLVIIGVIMFVRLQKRRRK